MRSAILTMLVAAQTLALAAMNMDQLGRGVAAAFAAQDFALLRPLVLNADDVCDFLDETRKSDEYRAMTPDERYLVDTWLEEAKQNTRQEFAYQLYQLQQQFEKLLFKGTDLYGIDWQNTTFKSCTYNDEIVSGVQVIRRDVAVRIVYRGQEYLIMLAGATRINGDWKAQYESLRLVKAN